MTRRRNRWVGVSVASIALLFGLLLFGSSAAAVTSVVTFTVNVTTDSVDAVSGDGICADASGNCSLRAAIMEADTIEAGSTITIPAGTYTITRGPADDESDNCADGSNVTIGDLDIYEDVTISGAGPGQTIIQMGALSTPPPPAGCTSVASDRIFDVDNDGFGGPFYDGLNVTITGVTLRNGNAHFWRGGAIRFSGLDSNFQNTGTLTLTNCAITGNNSSDKGGAVSVGGIRNSVAFGGNLSISNCTFSGNSATLEGGAIAADLTAGGTGEGSATISNTTFSGNTSRLDGGGGFFVSGPTTLTNVTLTNNRADSDANGSGNGGGLLRFGGTVKLQNTIVAGNFRQAGTAASDVSGTLDSTSSYNLIGTGGSGGLTNGTNNNQVGVSNPGLGPLAANGGAVQTHALLRGSPALDTGSNTLASGLSTDERGSGFGRVLDSADANTTKTVDIGALEQHPVIDDITNQSATTCRISTIVNRRVAISCSVGRARARKHYAVQIGRTTGRPRDPGNRQVRALLRSVHAQDPAHPGTRSLPVAGKLVATIRA